MFENESAAKNAAIYLLARREHSRKELKEKLIARSELIDLDIVLDELIERGYQSDQRFTESFIRMRASQGQGLIKIRFELQRKGVNSELIASAFEAAEIDWFELAADRYKRKYKAALLANDYKERAKRMRFMSQRGFNSEQIGYAIAAADESD
ncbi:regulatory protein RecX [Amphritea japonica]|uniref:Regulatory protein RecX n=1 Tax=Amphritea japonica ATCC BAA-1530 TaxID=1278309 RepID=A0A7R6PKE3_9GAMM|nr:regulatory protein RecX [Amphritea japonica]BBB25123.1 regulatory protein RecX [Amphritea japonica ATCC BAA-1530]